MVGDPYFLCSKKSYHHLHPLLLEGEHYFFNRSENKIKCNLNIFEMVA